MAEYHGDISRYDRNIYRSRTDKNLFIALAMLMFVGFTGLHRFYLGHMRLAWMHLGMCFVAVMFGIFTFNFWLAMYVFAIQGVILTFEFIFMIVNIVREYA